MKLLAVLLLALSAGIPADPGLKLAEDALARMATVNMDAWHYRRSLVTSSGSRLDRHDPTLPAEQHWQLISKDGSPPTENELDDYADNRTSHAEDEVSLSSSDKIIDLLQPGSLKWLEQDERGARYGFGLRSPNGKKKKSWARVTGEFHVQFHPGGPYIDSVRVWNTEAVYPRIGVYMKKLAMEAEFTLIGAAILPKRFHIEFDGRAWLFMKLDDDMTFVLDNYRYEPDHDSPPDVQIPEDSRDTDVHLD